MKLTDVLCSECIRIGAFYDDKAIALCEIASLAKKSAVCRHVSEEDILEALQDRETIGSTAFGGGVAVPHCRMSGIQEFVLGAVTVPGGVDFEAPDGQKVQLLIFIIAPADRPNMHIRLLSSISQALQSPSIVGKLIEAPDEKSFSRILIRSTGADIPTEAPSQKSLLHVFVQDEPIFKEILAALSGLESGSLAILSAENSHKYLSQLPLYAGFSNNNHSALCRVIVGIAEQRLNNEIIRRIENVTGPLRECSGVMVTIQNLSYTAGSLQP